MRKTELRRMPLGAKKVAASYSTGGVKIPRAPLVSCLTCPLCSHLFREATTISECLHTFCRECIHSRLSDGETNSCPMCNVSLGTLPLEKMRADHQLEDVKTKLFPDFSQKKKNGPVSSPAMSNTPLRRKERSLYSLGIGAQPTAANPGLATRTTKLSSGKSVAGRVSSSSDESREDDEMDEDDENLEEDGGPEKYRKAVLNESTSPISVRSTRALDFEVSSDEEILRPRPSRAKEEPRRAPIKETASVACSDVGLYLAYRSVINANGHFRVRSGNTGDVVVSAEESLIGGASHDGRTLNADNLLATLAEVAGADSSTGGRQLVKSTQAQISHPTPLDWSNVSPQLVQVRDSDNGLKGLVLRPPPVVTEVLESVILHPSPPRARRSSPKLQRNPSLKTLVNGGIETPTTSKHPIQPLTPANGLHLASTSLAQSNCGIWFALQAAQNQSDNPLPQLTSPYLRIKDGKLPVSHVKKYLVYKLGLSNETEVEITCRGQPVVSSLPLESVRNIWFATAAISKDQEDQGLTTVHETTTGLMHLDTSSAKELIMVLTYQRHRRNSRIC